MSNSNKGHLFAEERKSEIIELIKERDKILVPELVRHFKVSPATIRNDLRDLEQMGLIKRTHGGALSLDFPSVGFEKETTIKGSENLIQKQSIARQALEYVEEGDIIVLDAGTTSIELAKLLKNKDNITVVVNDIDIAACFDEAEGIQVLIIGGILRKKFHCTVGPFATKTLNELNVDKAFLTTNSLSIDRGCTTPDIAQAEVKKIMAQIASQVIVLCDSSKIGINSFVQFIPFTEIDLLITDHCITSEELLNLVNSGLDVVVA
ncbi:DeoR/GlpR family DNA-binding transcription regulator [Paenibacillus radicis (ex Xue et al. 2023)]|uniref:DeoR/GlpR family DNA-binding transcription regulator n=1 Tax=Paenibacillus radicis (ex Xue et al. 2023) TaxID=2972489 RepID=A0ABT1YIP5_9BACL|nr:DeoR/GlpR family DNA-binding transcription regulator [Paenibacillus radicis (ex Xue et al. 2023)]MCR8633046.1 DeoR/GlpR family DNA-binding transcription regulator [Paenibacillus radicis (ex Xue et al. 2023)]